LRTNPVIAELLDTVRVFTPEEQRVILDHAKWKRDSKAAETAVHQPRRTDEQEERDE